MQLIEELTSNFTSLEIINDVNKLCIRSFGETSWLQAEIKELVCRKENYVHDTVQMLPSDFGEVLQEDPRYEAEIMQKFKEMLEEEKRKW